MRSVVHLVWAGEIPFHSSLLSESLNGKDTICIHFIKMVSPVGYSTMYQGHSQSGVNWQIFQQYQKHQMSICGKRFKAGFFLMAKQT